MRTKGEGPTNTILALTVDRAEAKIDANVTVHAGVSTHAAQEITRRMASRFPYRDGPVETGDSEARALEARLRDLLGQAQALTAGLQASVRESTIKHHAAVYRREAIGHDRWAQLWLLVACLAVVGLVVVATLFFQMKVPRVDGAAAGPIIAAHFFAKLTLFSIPATALGVAIRQYGAARHNWVVATHRSSALASYEAFAKATDDKSAKDALLAQALGLIFSPQDTGYSKAAPSPDSTPLFTELVKQLSGSGSGKG